jgi:hypothetical protein
MAELTTSCLVVVALDDEAAAVMLYCCTIVDVRCEGICVVLRVCVGFI